METEILLVATAFLTSALSGVLGMGGGMLMLGVMAAFFPPAVLIPLHGIVQLASNGFRAGLSFKSVNKKILRVFALGAVVGALLGSRILIQLPETASKLLLGGFILVMTWMPPLKAGWKLPGKFFFVAVFNAFMGLFIGATGPLLAPFFLRENLPKETHLATQAACQFCVHLVKIVTFFALGFAIGPYLGIVVALVAAVLAGSVAAKHVFERLPEKWFRFAVKWTITALAVRMILMALQVT